MKDVTKTKLKVIGVIFIFLIIGISMIGNSNTPRKNQRANMVKINQVLKTRYFDVMVNGINFQKIIYPANGYGVRNYERGIKYLIIDLTIKNTDNESRIAVNGTVFIDYNGKRLKFDEAENIVGPGWGLLETLNPMIAIRTNVVYKLPEEITGQLYYQPGRSSSDEIIHIGTI